MSDNFSNLLDKDEHHELFAKEFSAEASPFV